MFQPSIKPVSYFFALLIASVTLSCNSNPPSKKKIKTSQGYSFSVPKGWQTEKFPLPVSFAPSISYAGFEDIRFAPGWANGSSEEHWSYAFLWWIDGTVQITDTILQNHLNAYYTGLVKTNIRKEGAGKWEPAVAAIKKIATAPGDIETYNGSVTITNYLDLTNPRLVLNCIIHKKTCHTHTALLFEISPKAVDHIVWSSLHQLNEEFACED
jgi:hypothetical protein